MPDEPTKRTTAQRRRAMREAEEELALTEAQYTTGLLKQLMQAESKLQESQFIMAEPDENNWESIGGRTTQKTLSEARDPATVRKQMYRFWRFNPHARGILRNFVRFIVGSGFNLDIDDPATGDWADEEKTKLKVTKKKDDSPIVQLLWEDFEARNNFRQRAKEIVLRTFRDGECFIRKFERKGRVYLRFVEPEHIANPGQGLGGTDAASGTVLKGDLEGDEFVGDETRVKEGIEFLATDVETVVAYHITPPRIDSSAQQKGERVPAAEMIHVKALCDSNDLRGIPVLEVVAKNLTNYNQWEEYRMILNKMRTAIALVRKVTGTSTQAEAIIRGRMSPRQEPHRLEPQTTSGRREAMFRAGTTLTPSPGVEYQFISPNLEARDASEDGRRFLMSIAAGVGLPEMLVTGDWSNSNFASSVEARTPAVREWEDWQEFFSPVFKRIYVWVVLAGIEDLGLPKDTSREVALQWPPLIAKDVFRETERMMNLWASGLLSKQTWSALEDLHYDDEQQNIREELDDEAVIHNAEVVSMQARPTRGQAGKAGNPPAPETGENPYVAPVKKPTRQITTQRGAKKAKPTETEEGAVAVYHGDLITLQEEIDAIEDPILRAAMERYMESANRALVLGVGRRNGHAAPPRRRLARPRR